MLLVGNEHRGNDATGMAVQLNSGHVHVLKSDIPAWKFVAHDMYKSFIEKHLPNTRAVILHTRGASQGNPRDNNNNHPMFAGKAAVIHNGAIRNDHSLFTTLNLERKADTDTDIIRAIVDKYGITKEGVDNLNKMSGSMASAVFHPDFPGKMLLMRSGAPMTLGSTQDLFMFASEKNTLHRCMRPMVERFGVPFQVHSSWTAFAPMPDHTAWIMGDKGRESHHYLKTLDGQYNEPWRKTYEEYSSRQERFDREWKQKQEAGKVQVTDRRSGKKLKGHVAAMSEGEFAWCARCNREWVIPIGADVKNFSCNKLNVKPGCGGDLIELPEQVKIARSVN